MAGGESGAAGRLHPSPRVGLAELAQLAKNPSVGAACLVWGGCGWQLVFLR